MIGTARSVALWAALVFGFAASAQAQQSDPAARDDSSYLPPSQFIAKTPTDAGQRSAATSSTAPPPAAKPATKTIGIMSVVGETFWVKRVGITVFGNETEKVAIAAWKIDDKITANIGRVLRKNFRVKRIQIPVGAFDTFLQQGFFFKSYEAELAKFLAPYALTQKCDYYLLVAPGASPLSSTNQGVSGLGLLRWGSGEYLYALSALTVFDAQMKQLRSQNGSIDQETFMATIKGPHQELKDAKAWPADAKAAAADPRAQKMVWELLDKSLNMTVPKLFAVN